MHSPSPSTFPQGRATSTVSERMGYASTSAHKLDDATSLPAQPASHHTSRHERSGSAQPSARLKSSRSQSGTSAVKPSLDASSPEDTPKPLRNQRDPHGSQPFRRYYIGPSPVSSSTAKHFAAAIKEDQGAEDPIGIAVPGKPGFTLIRRGPNTIDEHGLQPLDEDVSPQYSPLRHTSRDRGSGYASEEERSIRLQKSKSFDRSSLPRLRNKSSLLTATPDQREGRPLSKKLSFDVPPQPSRVRPDRQFRSYDDNHVHRSPARDTSLDDESDDGYTSGSLRPPGASAGQAFPMRRLRTSPGESALPRTLDLRKVPSAHSLTHSSEGGRSPEKSRREHRSQASLRDTDALTRIAAEGAESRQEGPAEDSISSLPDRERAGTSGLPRRRQPSVAFNPDTATTEGFRKRRQHARDVSRMSRASTIGTVGSRVTEGSFGASGGFRARIVRALQPGAHKSSLSSLRGRSKLHEKPSIHELRTHRRRFRSGVAPGEIGTSGGGTKWVGQSFEVGARFWDILEAKQAEHAQAPPSKGSGQSQRQPSKPSMSQTSEMAGTAQVLQYQRGSNRELVTSPMPLSPAPSSPIEGRDGRKTSDSRHNMGRTPSAILTAFAHDASRSQDRKQNTLAAPSQTPSLASNESVVPQVAANKAGDASKRDDSESAARSPTKTKPVSYANRTLSDLRRGSRENAMRRSISIMSVEPNEQEISSYNNALARGHGADIESRHGWSDVVSMMSTNQSSLHSSSNISRSIRSKAEQRLIASRRGWDDLKDRNRQWRDGKKSLGPTKTVLSTKDHDGMLSPTSQFSARTGGEVFKTPLTTPGGIFYDALSTPASGTSAPRDYFGPDAIAPGSPKSVSASKGATAGRPSVEAKAATNLSSLRYDVFAHPEPPIEAEEKFPEVTLNLLRRPSDPGHNPNGVTSDAASDHDVVVRSTGAMGNGSASMHSPGGLSANEDRRARERMPTGSTVERLGSLPDSQTPLLRNKLSTGSMIIYEDAGDAEMNGDAKPKTAWRGRNGLKKGVTFSQDQPRFLGLQQIGRSLSTGFLAPKDASGRSLVNGSSRSSPSGDEAPAPPEEVLSRTPSFHQQPFSPAAEEHDVAEFVTRKTVLRRDRMLIKNDWTPSEAVPADVDETMARRLSVHPGQWREYMVILRQGRIELWDEPTLASKLSGHSDKLHLKFVIPLTKGSTHVSIFSHIDRIFCLSYSQHHASTHISGGGHKRVFNLRKSGTNLLLFDARALSVSADWIWDLWREIGGTIPDALEVRLPAVNYKVRFPIPEEMPAVDDDDEMTIKDTATRHLAAPTYEVTESSRVLGASKWSSDDGGEGYKILTRQRLVAKVLALTDAVPELSFLRFNISDFKCGLAWRRGTTLDWIINDNQLDGQVRHWAVLCGGVLRESKGRAALELRRADHYRQNVPIGNGKLFQEPPGIEGFVWRVKPVSGALTRVYITTHDGHSFICRPSRAFPPDRHVGVGATVSPKRREGSSSVPADHDPKVLKRSVTQPSGADFAATASASAQAGQRGSGSGSGVAGKKSKGRDDSLLALRQQVMDAITSVATTEGELQTQADAFRAYEKRRQFDQIANADGYIDLKDIFAIRHLGKETLTTKPGQDGPIEMPMPMAGPRTPPNEFDEGQTAVADEEEEEQIDIGGEEGLALARDRTAMRRGRQFEIVMSNGRVTRLEAYSRDVAREWVARIHDLAYYWKRREKADAVELMEASGFDPALIRRKVGEGNALDKALASHGGMSLSSNDDVHNASEKDIDPLVLGNIWNWCTILGCRGIIRCGRLFSKKRAFAPFQSRYYILIAGRILCYKLLTSTRTARGRQNAGLFHRKTETVIHLRDSYVWSGKLTEDMLTNGRSEGAGAMGDFASGGVADAGYGRHKIPRMYKDGLLSIDEDEDCTFVIRYRPQRVNPPTEPVMATAGIAKPGDPADVSSSSKTKTRASDVATRQRSASQHTTGGYSMATQLSSDVQTVPPTKVEPPTPFADGDADRAAVEQQREERKNGGGGANGTPGIKVTLNGGDVDQDDDDDDEGADVDARATPHHPPFMNRLSDRAPGKTSDSGRRLGRVGEDQDEEGPKAERDANGPLGEILVPPPIDDDVAAKIGGHGSGHRGDGNAEATGAAGGAGDGADSNGSRSTPTPPTTNASLLPTIAVPSLNDPTFNIIVLRARSRLERDLWVRAIGYERERIVREEQRWGSQREVRVREMGRCDWKG